MKRKLIPEPAILWKNKENIPQLLQVPKPQKVALEIQTQISKPKIFVEDFFSEIFKNLSDKEKYLISKKIAEMSPFLRIEKRKKNHISKADFLKFIDKKFWYEEKFTVKGLLYYLPFKIRKKLYNSWGVSRDAHLRNRLNMLHNTGWLKKSKEKGKNYYSKSKKFKKFKKKYSFFEMP